MAERLTVRHGDRTYCNTLCMGDCNHCWHLGIIREKLARLEGLEEQGRLLVLPENITLEMLTKTLCNNDSGCPGNLGLKENCKLSCEECWLAALKGAEYDTGTND